MARTDETTDIEVINLFDDSEDYDDFDPLEIDDTLINQEEMDDDNPYDTIDFPTMRNMPEEVRSHEVFTPEHMGSAAEAVRALCTQNPARRPVLLNLIGLCEGGAHSSEISKAVATWQKDNRSVYSPLMLCRMLERAGALTFIEPEATEEVRKVEEGITYLEIKEEVDPVWVATEEALQVRDELTNGDEFRCTILEGKEATYLEVYAAVMNFLAEKPRMVAEVESLTDTFSITKSPKRYGTHFIDVLERCDSIAWQADGWALTDLGTQLLPELQQAADALCVR